MIGSIRSQWAYTWSDIWEPLTDEIDAGSFFIELYRESTAFLSPKRSLTDPAVLEVLGDPIKAFEKFQFLSGRDFSGEVEIINFLEAAYDAIDEFGGVELANQYVQLVQEFIQRYNLRYKVSADPFKLRIQIPWLYADLYRNLDLLHQENDHLQELMNDFEQAFDLFVRSKSERDMKTSISKASMYAEGVAGIIVGNPSETLGAASKIITDWPHATLRDSLGKIYGFCSNYPGIRHAGNIRGKLRDLKEKDTVLISALLMAYSSYIASENIDQLLE